jgi:hypothetical protein
MLHHGVQRSVRACHLRREVLTRFTAETATCTSVKSDYKSIMHIASQTKFETWWGWLTGWLASGSAWQLSGRSLTGARRESGGSLRCPLRSGLSQPAAHGSSTSGNSIGNLEITDYQLNSKITKNAVKYGVFADFGV